MGSYRPISSQAIVGRHDNGRGAQGSAPSPVSPSVVVRSSVANYWMALHRNSLGDAFALSLSLSLSLSLIELQGCDR